MSKPIFYLCASITLVACGGSGGSTSNDSLDDTYLNYMKTAYSEYVGELSIDNDSRYAQDHLALESPAIVVGDASSTAASESTTEFNAYSETNVQVAGVDEASRLKFDGQHLLAQYQPAYYYVAENASQPRVSHFSRPMLAGQEEEDPTLHFSPDPEFNYLGILRNGNFAALVGYKSTWWPYRIMAQAAGEVFCYDCANFEPEIKIYTWQYTQDSVALPPQTQQISVDGAFNQVRLIGSKLYFISQFSPRIDGLHYYPSTPEQTRQNQQVIDELTLEDVSPYITINGQSQSLVSSKCNAEQNTTDSVYRRYPQVISITQLDIEAPDDWQSNCIIGDISGAFFSLENIYLSRWKWQENETEIVKFSTSENDGVVFEATGSVRGNVSSDSYYFGEVDGHLVYVNTLYDNASWWNFDGRHQLSVFEQNGTDLELIAQLPNENAPTPIGKPGEQIYAVRIIDERAYIVTFDKVDPLYVIDLGDPASPTILGELEIPGFSSYIHPVNSELLIGVGKNAETYDGITWYQGLNIRLFDVSDPSQPLVLQSLDYGLRGSNSPVSYNPHSFTYAFDEQAQRVRFTIPMSLHGNNDDYDPEAHPSTFYDWEETGLYQFELNTDENPQIQEVARYLYDDATQSYSATDSDAVIDDNNIYLLRHNLLEVLNWGETTVVRRFELTND